MRASRCLWCLSIGLFVIPAAETTAEPPRSTSALGPLRTKGRLIVDARGNRVKLAGVSWYGMEGTDCVPAGLHERPLAEILATVRRLGFNHVRLPFSVATVRRNPVVARHLEANPGLEGKRALEILDAIVAACAAADVAVLLDCHRLAPGWGDVGQEHGLWYSPEWPEKEWIAAWVSLARRYAGNRTVIAADLLNEPHGRAVWGGGDPAIDWRSAAERCGSAVLEVNPDVLIVVEGTAERLPGESHASYWWGGNLSGAATNPVRLPVPARLVYSPHEYGPCVGKPPWVADEGALHAAIGKAWGYLLVEGRPYTAPVYVGEFGTCNGLRAGESEAACLEDQGPFSQGRWFRALTKILNEGDVDWCYWSLNATTSTGTEAGRVFGSLDFYGVLAPGWQRPASAVLLGLLQGIQPVRAK
jgi:endoglucanase